MKIPNEFKLMLIDKEILNVKSEQTKIIVRNLLPLSLRSKKEITYKEVISWLKNRTLSVDRINAKRILTQLQLPHDDKEPLILHSRGMSLSDSYWVKINEEDNWDELNFYNNLLEESIIETSLSGKTNLNIKNTFTPELVTQGVYAKAWVRKNNKTYMYKANVNRNTYEDVKEYLSTKILEILEIPHVPYEMEKIYGLSCCKCPNISSEKESVIPYQEFYNFHTNIKSNPINYIIKNYYNMFYKMILFDGIVNNIDRHGYNWGFIMDNKTGQIKNIHPLFDHNNAFDLDSINPESLVVEGRNLLESSKYAYNKLNKPYQVKELLEWLNINKTKRLFKKLFKGTKQWELVKYNLEYILNKEG